MELPADSLSIGRGSIKIFLSTIFQLKQHVTSNKTFFTKNLTQITCKPN